MCDRYITYADGEVWVASVFWSLHSCKCTRELLQRGRGALHARSQLFQFGAGKKGHNRIDRWVTVRACVAALATCNSHHSLYLAVFYCSATRLLHAADWLFVATIRLFVGMFTCCCCCNCLLFLFLAAAAIALQFFIALRFSQHFNRRQLTTKECA